MADPGRIGADVYGAAAVGAAALALCDTLHELAHLAATLLPLHVSVLSISSVGISTTASSPVVALAGPLANLLLAGALALARPALLPADWRYFAWLFGTINAFNGVAYLLYSTLLESIPHGLKGSSKEAVQPRAESLRFDRTWLLASCLASLAFVVVLGRGLQFTPGSAS